jgi:hypothetical protein
VVLDVSHKLVVPDGVLPRGFLVGGLSDPSPWLSEWDVGTEYPACRVASGRMEASLCDGRFSPTSVAR